MSEWIKHTGTTNPVPDTEIEVYLDDGSVYVVNSGFIDWSQPTSIGDGSVAFYRVVDLNNTNSTNNTTFSESIPKDTLKVVLANALKNRKDIGGLYADLIELL